MTSRISIALLFLLAVAPFCLADDNMILATVNDEEITADMFLSQLKSIHSAQSEEVHRTDFDPDRLLQKMINDRLLTQDAYALGLDQEQTVKDAVGWFRETAAYQQLLEDVQPETIDISEAELRAGFEKYYRRAMLRLICVGDSALSSAIADSIRMQGVSMATMATRHAIDKFKTLGGDAGVFPLYDIPESLANRLEFAQAGELLGPLYLWSTWTLARADAFLPPDEAIYDSVQVIIRKQLILDKAAQQRREFIAREGAGITVWADSAAARAIPLNVEKGVEGTTKPILRVGDSRVLTEADFRSKYAHRFVARNDRDAQEVVAEVLDEQYQVMMLKEIAKQRKYLDDPRLDAAANAFRDSMLVVNYLDAIVAPTVRVGDAEIKTFYDANVNRFRSLGRARVAIITRETLEQAQQDFDRIIAGADFAWIAGQYSIDEYKDRGGLREWVELTALPSFIAAQLDTLTVGNCLPPLLGDEGFVVMKLVEREAGSIRTLDEVRSGITGMLQQQKQRDAIEETLRDLRAEANIVVNEAAMRDLQIVGTREE